MLLNEFKKPQNIEKIVEYLKGVDKKINIMEVCGTHTMAIAKFGIKSLLPSNIRLISGPGCPVCVTSQKDIDYLLIVAESKDFGIITFGDLVNVPVS